MAATDPEESPKPPTFPSEDVETSEQTNESTESGGAVHIAHEASSSEAKENSGDTQEKTLARHSGICVSHSSVSVESGAGNYQATHKSSDEQKQVENMKDVPADEQRAFGGCEMQEDNDEEETKTPGQETGMRTCFYVLYLLALALELSKTWGSTVVLI